MQVMLQHAGIEDERSRIAAALDHLIEHGVMVEPILIVDPTPGRCAELCAGLRQRGRSHIVVATPLEAIDVFQRTWPNAVVIAPSLTQTSARELARFLGESRPDLHILIA
jgi:DNA-binding response OmpR family regulator